MEFKTFLKVDRGLTGATLKDYACDVRVFLNKCGLTISKSDVRYYLEPLTNNRRRKVLCALKQFYRFIEEPQVTEGFKIPRSKSRIVLVPSKQELARFCEALPNNQRKTFFMMLASSGLRLSELLNIELENVDFGKRMLIPDYHEGATKHDYVTFYNEEAEETASS